MFGRKNIAERLDRLEEMVLDMQWGRRNIDNRVQLLEEKILKKEIKEYNKKATKKDEPKRKVGRPRKTERVDLAKKK